MGIILKRGLKVFAVSVTFVAATLGFAYFVDLAGAGIIRRWIAGRIFSHTDQTEPLLYAHVYVIMDWAEFLGLFLLYSGVCVALAWCWTWIKTRVTLI